MHTYIENVFSFFKKAQLQVPKISLLLFPQTTAMAPWYLRCPILLSAAPLSLQSDTRPTMPSSTEETVSADTQCSVSSQCFSSSPPTCCSSTYRETATMEAAEQKIPT